MRTVLALATAAALTLGVSACGRATAPTGASPSTSPSPTSSTTARPSATATPSMDEVYAKSVAAVKDADSVRMRVTNKDASGDTFTVDVRGALDGSWEQLACREPDGSSWTKRIVGDQVFIKANETYWRRADLPGLDPARPADRWVKLTGDVPEEVASPALMGMLLGDLSDWEPGALRHEVAEVTAEQATGTRVYRAYSGGDDNEFVVDASTWLPARFTALAETGAMTATLTGWNTIARVTAPTGYATLRLDAG